MDNLHEPTLPSEHHFINLHYKKKTYRNNKGMVVNGVLQTDKTWAIFKAGQNIAEYHFKNSPENNITLYVTTTWLEEHVFPTSPILADFFASDNPYILLQDVHQEDDEFYQQFLELAQQQEKSSDQWMKTVDAFIAYLSSLLSNQQLSNTHFKLSDSDRKHVYYAETLLKDNLLRNFPGIEEIAKTVGISPTKLKNNFKIIHQKSLYQYFRYQQMLLAHRILSEQKKPVKEVALLLGYQNHGKFSSAFKAQFGMVPSALHQL